MPNYIPAYRVSSAVQIDAMVKLRIHSIKLDQVILNKRILSTMY